MGVFSNRAIGLTGSYEAVDLLDESIDITGVRDLEDDAIGALVAESEANYALLMRTVGVCELAAIEENGEAIYEASDASGFFGKIKEFFKGILEKIKRIFKNFLVKFDSLTKSNKDFVTKYKKQINEAKTTDFEYNGYNFTYPNAVVSDADVAGIVQEAGKSVYGGNLTTSLDDVLALNPEAVVDEFKNGKNDNTENKTSEDCAAFDEKYDDLLEEMRGKFAEKAGSSDKSSMTQDEFTKALFAAFRDNEDDKQKLEASDINKTELMATMVNYEKTKKTTDDAYKKTEKFINKYMSLLDRAENQLLKDVPGKKDKDGIVKADKQASQAVSVISRINRLMKDAQQMMTQVHNAHLRALKDHAQQSKAICVKLITRKANESAEFGDDDFGVTHSTADVFANVNFI